MSGPVQTKCACGHSARAHERGACQGIDAYTAHTSQGHRAISLCECPSLHDAYTVPAVALPERDPATGRFLPMSVTP